MSDFPNVNGASDLVVALRGLPKIIEEVHAKWDEVMRAGKLLIALMDPSLKYRDDITAIHTAIAKAEADAAVAPPPVPLEAPKYLNLVDGNIYELISEDASTVTFRREGREKLAYLGRVEFDKRFRLLSAPAPLPHVVVTEPEAETAEPERVYFRFVRGDAFGQEANRLRIRKWDTKPFDGASQYVFSPTHHATGMREAARQEAVRLIERAGLEMEEEYDLLVDDISETMLRFAAVPSTDHVMGADLTEFRKFVDLIEGRTMACDGPVTPFLEQLNVASDAEKELFTGILRKLYSASEDQP